MFTRNPNLKPAINLTLYNTPLNLAKEAKFLGITFQQNMAWTFHINNLVKEGNQKLNHLKVLSALKHGASLVVILKVFKSYLRSLTQH